MMAGFGEFVTSVAMRDLIQRIAHETVDRLRPPYRYGMVTSIDELGSKCGVTLNGDTAPVLVNMGTIQPSTVGQTVRVEGMGTDKFITDVIGESQADVQAMTNRYQRSMVGGGVRLVTADRRIKWSQRFISLSWAKNSSVPSGYFDISPMTPGQVIRNPEDGTSVTVDAQGYVQLPNWGSLWYQLPYGKNNAFVPANLFITSYIGADQFVAQSDWVLIATNALQAQSGAVRWGDGLFSDYWRTLPLLNGWVRHTTTNTPPSYQKRGDVVYVRGLLQGGVTTAETAMANLPAGYRPAMQHHFPVTSANLFGSIGVGPTGNIVFKAGSNTWISLDNVSFIAEQ